MNKLYCLIILLLTCKICDAQNLVPNPSFEDTVGCPNGTGQVAQAQYWSSYGNSSDYFNTCATLGGVGIPTNTLGYQMPHAGNAYMGEFKFANATYEEFIGAQLIQPLIVGTKYFLSFYVNKSSAHLCAVNDFGLRFSNVAYSFTNPAPTDNFSHCHSTTVITDTVNWVQIAGSFVADSAYQFIIIGNFYDTAHINQLNCPVPGPSYYYIDDVCVSVDSLTCFSPVGINEVYNTDNFILFPNPFTPSISITLQNQNLKQATISIKNILGQTVFLTPLSLGEGSGVRLDLSFLERGIYLVEVVADGERIVRKVVKE